MEQKTTVITQEQLALQQEACEKINAYWMEQEIHPVAFVDTYGCQQNEADSSVSVIA